MRNAVGIFLLFAGFVDSSRILGIFPHPAMSHFKAFRPILVGLAERGHDVVVVSHFPETTKRENYHDIVLEQEAVITDSLPVEEVYTPRTYWNLLQEFYALADEGKSECEELLKARNLDKIFELSQEKPFDILITEYFNTECSLGVAHKANITSFIGLSSCALLPWHYDRVGLPDTPSFIPSEFDGFSDTMNFLERFKNWITVRTVKFLYRQVELEDNRLLRERFGDGIPDVADLVRQTKLILVNQHFSFSGPRPLPPNVIEIGGIHIDKERKPLPTDLKEILDNAKHGVIYVSWGSHIKSQSISGEKLKGIINVFKKFPQTILWKWESDQFTEEAGNIHTRKWMPQIDVLCHPNVVAFMSHGGLMGTTEAVYCGVPTVVTPIYGDQFLNGAALVHRGMGAILHYSDINERSVHEALSKVINPTAKENARFVSMSFRNRLTDPLQTALWWTEFIADKSRNGGKLLKSQSVELNWFNYHSIDVIIVLLCALALTIYLIDRIIRLVVNGIKNSFFKRHQLQSNKKRN